MTTSSNFSISDEKINFNGMQFTHAEWIEFCEEMNAWNAEVDAQVGFETQEEETAPWFSAETGSIEDTGFGEETEDEKWAKINSDLFGWS